MDSELVNGSLSSDEAAGEGRFTSPFPYTEVFNKKFPYYLSIGMTEEQYWDKDSMLTRYYQEAESLRLERTNQELWLQGMYIYDAISRLSPILHAFVKKGTKAQPYVKEPYPINEKMVKDVEKEKEKQNSQKGIRYMEAVMVNNNKQFEERK